MAWLLAHDPHVLLIPGTSSLDHVEQDVAAGSIHLDPDTISELDRIADPHQ